MTLLDRVVLNCRQVSFHINDLCTVSLEAILVLSQGCVDCRSIAAVEKSNGDPVTKEGVTHRSGLTNLGREKYYLIEIDYSC